MSIWLYWASTDLLNLFTVVHLLQHKRSKQDKWYYYIIFYLDVRENQRPHLYIMEYVANGATQFIHPH